MIIEKGSFKYIYIEEKEKAISMVRTKKVAAPRFLLYILIVEMIFTMKHYFPLLILKKIL